MPELSDPLAPVLNLLDAALSSMENPAREAEWSELYVVLRELLIHVTQIVERNPGLDAAMSDLDRAASALVRDSAVQALPLARKLRMFREARLRFKERSLLARQKADSRMTAAPAQLLCA